MIHLIVLAYPSRIISCLRYFQRCDTVNSRYAKSDITKYQLIMKSLVYFVRLVNIPQTDVVNFNPLN